MINDDGGAVTTAVEGAVPLDFGGSGVESKVVDSDFQHGVDSNFAFNKVLDRQLLADLQSILVGSLIGGEVENQMVHGEPLLSM